MGKGLILAVIAGAATITGAGTVAFVALSNNTNTPNTTSTEQIIKPDQNSNSNKENNNNQLELDNKSEVQKNESKDTIKTTGTGKNLSDVLGIPKYQGFFNVIETDSTVQYDVKAKPKQVMDYYKDNLKKKGWSLHFENEMYVTNAEFSKGNEFLTVTVTNESNEGLVRVMIALGNEDELKDFDFNMDNEE